MKNKGNSLALVLLLALLFVSLGDRFLPPPLSNASLKARTALNQVFAGLVPNWQPKTNPYDRTEKAIDQEENNKPNK